MSMANFKDILKTSDLILVDFYADWCAPCKMMPPILKEVKSALGDQVKIIKIDVDKNPQISAAYNIRSIPTIMLFEKEKLVWSNAGVPQASSLINSIKTYI